MFGELARAACKAIVERAKQCEAVHRLDIEYVLVGSRPVGGKFLPTMWVQRRGYGGRQADAFTGFPQKTYDTAELAVIAARKLVEINYGHPPVRFDPRHS